MQLSGLSGSWGNFLTLNRWNLVSNSATQTASRDRAAARQLVQRQVRQLFAKMNEARILRSNVIAGDTVRGIERGRKPLIARLLRQPELLSCASSRLESTRGHVPSIQIRNYRGSEASALR